jgi:hypothetical protein
MLSGPLREGEWGAVEEYLGQLDSLAAAINSQRSIEGSTLLPELRREYRRFVALMRMPPYRPIFPGSSGTLGRVNR